MAREKVIKVKIDDIINLTKVAQGIYAYALKNEKNGIAEIRPEDLYKEMGYTSSKMIYNGLKELTTNKLLTKTGSQFRYYVKA